MAIRPDYQTGTIDLVAASADFTTTGAALQMVAVQPGDAIIAPSGHVLIIASITGQNSGTLFLPCPPAAAGTSLPLRIRFQPDGSRYQGAVRNMIDLLSSGNVEAFAALVGANGMVPIFTGVGTMDLADPATFGIQDPNGSLGKLAALTLAANKAITTDGSGNAQQSDIGTLGRALLALTGTNGNIPVMTGAGTVASRPIVGTVSQSGGIPTGALVEYGTNAGGQYFKFAGGLMICRAVRQAPQWVNVAEGALFRTAGNSYTFAASFSETPSISLFAEAPYAVCWAVANAVTNNSFYGRVFSPYSISENASITHIAVGRWHL